MTYYSTYYQERFPNVLSNIVTLLDTFRSIRDGDEGDPDAGPELQVAAAASGTNPLCCPPPPPPPASSTAKCEVIFTYLQSMTNDGRDISLDYKLSGPLLAGIPRSHVRGSSRQENDDNDALFLPDCRPSPAGRGDLRLPKTSCNVFASTNLDYLLRQLGVDTVVLAGQMTEQCVESAVRHAADLGYFAVVVSDACIAASQEAHDSSLRRMNGFARIVHTTAELVSEIRELAGSCKEHSKPTTREDRYQQVAK
jgi:nicotinamidase-related amidase